MSMDGANLKIDPALRLLVRPLSEAEYTSLERELLTVGSQKPVVCWYNFVISEYERWELCQKYQIPFEIKRINFRTEVDIIAMLCRQELRNHVLPQNMRRYLIGKQYRAEKIIVVHSNAGTDRCREKQHRELSRLKNLPDTRDIHILERLGSAYQLHPRTIAQYGTYADGIDAIFRDDPRKAERILKGTEKMSVDQVCNYVKAAGRIEKSESVPEARISGPSVKDMPEFDPDAEINSLALTIPSWKQSLDRIRATAQFPLLTEEAKRNLQHALRRLISAANRLDSALEVHHGI